MKRILTITTAMLIITCTMAYAGVFDAVTSYIKAEAVSILIGAAIGALGMLGATYRHWGIAVRELGEFVWAIYKATRPESEGGRAITKAEMEHIVQEAAEIYPAVSAAIASHKAQ